jgi:ribosomal protein L31E
MESVTITLEHYKELEFYKRQYEVLQEIRKDLVKILEDKDFSIDNSIDMKVFNVYNKIVSKETM